MNNNIEKILISETQIAERVKEMGKILADEYQDSVPLVVCVLKGSIIFFADLVRAMNVPVEIECIRASSYGSGTHTSGDVQITETTSMEISDRRILLIEDIVDSGNTINRIRKWFEERKPQDIKICTLLDKPERREVDVKVDYTLFNVPDEFVVGYGLDYDQQYRNLPYIGVLKASCYQ